MQSDQGVAFKVFLSSGDGEKSEVRRFGIDRSAVTSFEYLKAKLCSVFPIIKTSSFTVTWKDDEGDEVLISSDDELILALSSIQDDLKKLYVTKSYSNADVPVADVPIIGVSFAAPGVRKRTFDAHAEHVGVVCDSCDKPISGFRYKCISCEDFDLCSVCEGKNTHPEHFMIRIPVPVGPLGGKLSKVVGHKLFKSLRKARAFEGQNEGECPYKRHRKERHSTQDATPEGRYGRRGRHHGGRPHHGARHEGQGEMPEGQGRPGRHCGGRGWLDTFSTYINEFANLAGDLGHDVHKNATAAATAAAAGAAAGPVPNANPTPPSAPQASTNGTDANEANPQNGNAPTASDMHNLHVQYLQNIGRTVATILDPLGIDVDIDVRTNCNANTESQSCSHPETCVSGNSNLPEHIPTVDIDDSSSSSDDSDDSFSENAVRPEGWTLLNTDEPVKETSQSAPKPNINARNIGFDMEQMTREFNKHLELQARALHKEAMASSNSSGASAYSSAGIYPLIPEIVAVPSAPQENVPVSSPMEVVAEPLKQPAPPMKPAAPANTYKPSSPLIAESLERMLNMGFKDDNGRLARLLEAKNGNISAVLDILSQNIP